MKKEISQILEADAILIGSYLEKYLGDRDDEYGILIDSMRYSVFTGGKRIRPMLALEFSRALGGNDEAVLPYACAIEMIHTYSLIHDDLPCMDNDDYRRGKLTNHKKFNEATALLAGDALLTNAFEVVTSNVDAAPDQNIEAVRLLAEAAGKNGMVGGQQMDLIGETRRYTLDELIRMNRLKTGCLFKAACFLGVIAAGKSSDEDIKKAVSAYADGVGLAFQIEDDILDDGEEDEKSTFTTLMSREEAVKKAEELTEEAKNAIKPFDKEYVLRNIADYLVYRKK